MNSKFPEYKNLDLTQINSEILAWWEQNHTFEKSISTREGQPVFVFYEGPPSANGMPGIHHVMARTIKDIVCRFKTLKGFKVLRKAGWDTHGLPVELAVEKKLNITKEDIGKTISVEEYNKVCRSEVMKYTGEWEKLTKRMGYWVDMPNAYITYDNRFIETLWYLLKQLYQKGLLYKGFTIQPYSPAAGTGLSSHELNIPGCYRDVKDTTAVAQFKVLKENKSEFLFTKGLQPYTETPVYFLAWTTTPWTLLSNTALALGREITYVRIHTVNPYTGKVISVILAKALMGKYFVPEGLEKRIEEFKVGDKVLPYSIMAEYQGAELEGVKYEQLLPYQQPKDGDAFRVVCGDFVSTEDGTGIVHIAPSFGSDDFKVAKQNGIGSLTLVDRQGKFVENCGEFSGRYVKNAYDNTLTDKDLSVDIDICVKLKKEDKLFKSEKYEHSYPHCWRTDKPILYYPLDSWFVKSTAYREQMIHLNNTINWQPAATGTGRFGKWLENLMDWNLSRSRYWGTPLPIWRTEDGSEEICIGSVEELKDQIESAVKVGFMEENPLKDFVLKDNSSENYHKMDLHRPYVDNIVLVSATGRKMYRETDLIDVWFDSGAVPYAQLHYPFENKELIDNKGFFPADFISEGVDQTRGWFFTLHALSTMLFDSVAFKSVLSTGLVLDKHGRKMSKRLGNGVDPFEVMDKFGADPMRWYMITNSVPWDNLSFDPEGVDEVRRKFFGTLYNTYQFFSLYANVDGFTGREHLVPVEQRPEIDRWVLSLLNTLISEVNLAFELLDPTRAGRSIQQFVIEDLSNWYVRLNRKRYWGGEFNDNKLAAYQTLYTCLKTVAILSSPIAPFYSEKIYLDLSVFANTKESVHLTEFPESDFSLIDKTLEQKMELAQRISSMVLSIRRKVNIKVRQPLSKIIIPVTDDSVQILVEDVKQTILSEVNVKDLEFLKDTSGVIVKKIKPNFKALGARMGKQMKDVTQAIGALSQPDIIEFERNQKFDISINGQKIALTLEDVEIISEDMPGWQVVNDGNLTVVLDITVTEALREEGIARELINRIQNIRKESGLEVTDKILITIQKHDAIAKAVNHFKDYISTQTLALSVEWSDQTDGFSKIIDLDEEVKFGIQIVKKQ